MEGEDIPPAYFQEWMRKRPKGMLPELHALLLAMPTLVREIEISPKSRRVLVVATPLKSGYLSPLNC